MKLNKNDLFDFRKLFADFLKTTSIPSDEWRFILSYDDEYGGGLNEDLAEELYLHSSVTRRAVETMKLPAHLVVVANEIAKEKMRQHLMVSPKLAFHQWWKVEVRDVVLRGLGKDCGNEVLSSAQLSATRLIESALLIACDLRSEFTTDALRTAADYLEGQCSPARSEEANAMLNYIIGRYRSEAG